MSVMPENIQEWLKNTALQWATDTIEILSQKAKKVGIRTEGELLKKFTAFLAEATEKQVGISFQMPAYGKMIDMKALNPIQKGLWLLANELKDWIVRENIGFTFKNSKWSREKAQRNFAWAMARKKLKSQSHKRKRWFSKNFYGQINYLLEQIATGHAEYANLAITDNLK